MLRARIAGPRGTAIRALCGTARAGAGRRLEEHDVACSGRGLAGAGRRLEEHDVACSGQGRAGAGRRLEEHDLACSGRGLAGAGQRFEEHDLVLGRLLGGEQRPVRPSQPRGKQSTKYANYSVFYTRTTGIWQTVWMEPVPSCYLRRGRITPDVANGVIRLEQPLSQNHRGMWVQATLSDDGGIVARTRCRADIDLVPRLDLVIPADRQRLWSPHDPFLYDLVIELEDSNGDVIDRVTSYAGLRSLAIDGPQVKLNGEDLLIMKESDIMGIIG